MIDATTDLAQLPERVIRIKKPTQGGQGEQRRKWLNLVTVEERVRLNAVVRLLDTSVGVVNRSDAYFLCLANLETRTNTVFEVESRAKILIACRSA